MRAFVSLLALVAATAAAQPVTIPPAGSGAVSGGGPSSDVGERVAVNPYSGERVVVGTFEQTATFGGIAITSADAPASRSDAFVVLYDASGTALWARRMGTDVFNDFGAGAAISPSFSVFGGGSGAVYVSGFFTGVATFDGGGNPDATLTTRSDFDAFLASYSPTGDLRWVQQAGGTEQDTGRDVVVTSTWDGTATVDAVYWAGSFTGTATWGEGADAQTRMSAGSSDGFVARYDGDGALDWVLTGGGPESDDLRALSTSDTFFGGGAPLYAAGTFRSVATFGGTPLASRGLSDVAVLALNPADGSVTWVRQVGGDGNEYARGVAASFAGGLGVVGSFENTILVGTDVLTSAGFSDAFLVTFSYDGDEVSGHRGGGEGFDIANAVAANPFLKTVTGRGAPAIPLYAVVGYVDGPATFGTTPVEAQGLDAFAALYLDPAENFPDTTPPSLADVFLIGGTDSDRGYGVTVGGSSGVNGYDFPILVTGSFRGTVAFGDSTVTSAGSNDVFVALLPTCPTYSCPVTVAGEPTPANAVRLNAAPNPARRGARLSLALASASDATVEVVDALGRTVARLHRGPLAAGETAWTAPPLAPGAYWLVARAEGWTVRRSFIVVR